MNSIAIHTAKGTAELSLQNIIRIQGLSNYSRIFFADNRWPLTVAKGLKQFEAVLPDDTFIRSHRTHLINKNHIAHISINGRCNYITLHNGETIAISRRKRTALRGISANNYHIHQTHQ